MAINSDIKYYYSGGAAGVATTSLGGAISANQIVTSTDQNLFQNVGSAEAVSGSNSYLCLFIKNTSATKTYTGVGLFIATETDSPNSTIYVSKGTSAKNTAEQVIASVTTEPVSVIWQHPLFSYSTLALPDLAPGDYQSVWVKRTIAANAAGVVKDYFRFEMVGS